MDGKLRLTIILSKPPVSATAPEVWNQGNAPKTQIVLKRKKLSINLSNNENYIVRSWIEVLLVRTLLNSWFRVCCKNIIFSNTPLELVAGICDNSDSDDSDKITGVVTVDNFEERLRAREHTKAASDFMAFVTKSGGVTRSFSDAQNKNDDGNSSHHSSLEQSDDDDDADDDADDSADDHQSLAVSIYRHTCLFVSLAIASCLLQLLLICLSILLHTPHLSVKPSVTARNRCTSPIQNPCCE